MRKLILAVMFLMLSTSKVNAQTRVLLGGTGGDLYSNMYGSASGKMEIGLGKHLELDPFGDISPRLTYGKYTITTEKKTGLGAGWGYRYGGGGILWLNKSLGIDGLANASEYSVTATSKSEYFVQSGLVYRRQWFDMPTRFTFNYVREIANGIMPNGDETNRLQGGSVTIDTRFTCKGPFCLRLTTNIQTGRVTNQGSPICDGTFGKPITCPRSTTMSGGASMSLYFEFPRPRNHEHDVF